MKYGRTYNFSAGPAMMPEPVLEEIAAEMMNYRGSGMCVMEMSHRSKVFQQIIDEAEADLRKLMSIPDNYKVLFVQGGGTVQFAMVPMNLMKNGVACYVETGNWSKKAIKEAQKYGEVKIVASSADKNFSYIPDCSDLDIPDNADYVYICENETINGTTYYHLPNTKGKVLDVGCGAGVLSVAFARHSPKIRLTLCDVSAPAVEASRATLAANGVEGEVFASNVFSEVKGRFDMIISNPPFHDGMQTSLDAAQTLIRGAVRHLNSGGELRIVANAFLPYPKILDEVFGFHEVIAQTGRFKVYRTIMTRQAKKA